MLRISVKTLLISVLLCSAQSVTVLAQVSLPKTVIVSDIDDTLSESYIRHRGRYWAYLGNALRSHDFFSGMPFLFNLLNSQGMEVHYVTGMPTIIEGLATKFLQTSGFPMGHLWTRPFAEDTAEFKYNKILQILSWYPEDTKYIFFGDNGQHDAEVYHRFQKDPRFASRIQFVFIHKLYSPFVGSELYADQIPYLTPAEIFIELANIKILSEGALITALEQVRASLKSQFRSVRGRALPYFATIDPLDIERLKASQKNFSNFHVQFLIADIANLLDARSKETTVWERVASYCSTFLK